MTNLEIFKRVLVGSDRSLAPRPALSVASDLAEGDGDVTAVAVPDPTRPADSADGVPSVDGTGPRWFARSFDQVLATLPGSPAQFRIFDLSVVDRAPVIPRLARGTLRRR